MNDLFEAIEQLSALFGMRVENLCRKRGWAARLESRTLLAGTPPTRMVSLAHTTVFLPEGLIAMFRPRTTPEADGLSWGIDVQRGDGVTRESWAGGVGVRLTEDKGRRRYALWYPAAVLTDGALEALLDDLSLPFQGGLRRSVFQLWGMRFGMVPVAIVTQLEKTTDEVQLEDMRAAVLSALDVGDALEAFASLPER